MSLLLSKIRRVYRSITPRVIGGGARPKRHSKRFRRSPRRPRARPAPPGRSGSAAAASACARTSARSSATPLRRARARTTRRGTGPRPKLPSCRRRRCRSYRHRCHSCRRRCHSCRHCCRRRRRRRRRCRRHSCCSAARPAWRRASARFASRAPRLAEGCATGRAGGASCSPTTVRHPPRPLLDAQVRRGAARSELPQPGPERGAGPPAERRGGDEWRRDGGEGGVEREGARNHDPARREALCDHVPQQRHALLGEGVVSEGLGDDEVIPRRRLLLAPQQQHLALHRAQRDAARQVRRVRREGGRGGGHEVFVPLDGDDLRREIARRRGAGGEEGEEARAGADVEDAERRVAVSAACGEERQGLLQRRCVRLGALGVVHHKGAPRRQWLLEPSRG
mmetsp:Transcript_46294/g.149175  ORF Transcript_46294/g.149175 Transcript_46294/m.149175 type:complete len:395 (-) Transcript_46294:811-1995(-)